MAKIKTIESKNEFEIEAREQMESMTVRLPMSLADKLKAIKADTEAKGFKITVSEIIKAALLKAFGEAN